VNYHQTPTSEEQHNFLVGKIIEMSILQGNLWEEKKCEK